MRTSRSARAPATQAPIRGRRQGRPRIAVGALRGTVRPRPHDARRGDRQGPGEHGIDGCSSTRRPPTPSYLTPSTLLEHRVFQTVAPPKLAAGEKRSGKPDVFGALSLYQVLASRLDPGTALDRRRRVGRRLHGHVHPTRHRRASGRGSWARRGDGTKTIGDALAQWAAQMPAGAAQVDAPGRRGDAHRVRPRASRHRGAEPGPDRARLRREP